MHAKQTLLNLSLKTNRKTLLTPNQRIRITVRAVGMHFELAEYLERNLEKMKKMFGENKSEVKTVKEGLMENKIEFMKEFMAKLREYGTEE